MSEVQPFVRQEEANHVAAAAADKRLRTFVEFGVARAVMLAIVEKELPATPFDLKFFADVLVAMFNKRAVLESILMGDVGEFRWWTDDEDGIRPL